MLFGENWNNPDIDRKTRCIVTVVALMSSGVTDSSLAYHLENAKASGVTRTEIAAIVTHVAFYAGWPKAWAVFNVTFEPGCRNNWHVHHAEAGGEQILICVAGRGYYQEWGKEPQEMRPGDCINIPAEVKHWHGTAPDSWFSHLAIEVPGEAAGNEWCEPVSDEDYEKLR